MDSIKFGEDLSRKAALVDSLADHDFGWPDLSGNGIHFSGMGSSAFAAGVIATLLESKGIRAHSFLSSSATPPLPSKQYAYIAISATGKSIETNSVFEQANGYGEKLYLTNSEEPLFSPSINLSAGIESGGVASLTYVATLIALLKLADNLIGIPKLKDSIKKASESISDIYSRRDNWLPEFEKNAVSKDGTFFIAPAHRISSAQQSALMIRECARLSSDACETGDWAHVDVYLTKTKDYRAVIFPGSSWEPQFFEWSTLRNSTVIGIGFENQNLTHSMRYPHDDDEIVRLLTELTFAELLGLKLWNY